MHACALSAVHRARDERGAVGILFSVLLATGVLFGLMAITFDFGNLNANHSQLQSSADAAALVAARTCATTGTCPDPAALDMISQLNDSGSTNSSTVLPPLCGVGGNLVRGCTDDNNRVTLCPQTGWTGNYVEVHTQKTTDVTFADNGNGVDQSGQACAAAAWGPVGGGTVLPLTIPACMFNTLTSDGTDLGTPDSHTTVAIAINAQAETVCPGQEGPPGGKGWLDPDESGCATTAVVGESNTGAGKGSDYTNCFKVGTVLFLPIYDATADTGTNGTYHIVGITGFYLAGFTSPSVGAQGITGTPPCPTVDYNVDPAAKGTGNRCIWGYFTSGVVPLGQIDVEAPETGVTAIQMIG